MASSAGTARSAGRCRTASANAGIAGVDRTPAPIIGLEEGAASLERLDRMIDAGVQVAGLRPEDWAGCGGPHSARAVFWNWQRDPAPPPAPHAELGDRGIPIPGRC